MKIIIDCREQSLFENLLPITSEIIYEKKNLEIGDVVFESDEGKIILIIERKTVDDLLSSLKDGRYVEQSFRLNALEEVPNHHIYYLIEGKLDRKNEVVYSSMFSLSYFKGFSILKTANVSETAFMITQMAKKLLREKDKRLPYYSNESIEEVKEETKTKTSYCTVLQKSKKSKNIQPDNFGEIILCQIPGVSSTIAILIMKHYKLFKNLLEDENKKVTLSTLVLDSKRKLSKTVVDNIILFVENW